MTRKHALVAMTGVQLTAAVGAVLTLVGATMSTAVTAVALAIAAGTFLHIVEVDLIPTFLGGDSRNRHPRALIGLSMGIALIVIGTAL